MKTGGDRKRHREYERQRQHRQRSRELVPRVEAEVPGRATYVLRLQPTAPCITDGADRLRQVSDFARARGLLTVEARRESKQPLA